MSSVGLWVCTHDRNTQGMRMPTNTKASPFKNLKNPPLNLLNYLPQTIIKHYDLRPRNQPVVQNL